MHFFKNKSFNVKVIDDPPPHIMTIKPVDYEKLVWTIVKGSAIVIGVYMGADTIRQISIEMMRPL